MQPPKIIKPYVLTFCRSISKELPVYVNIKALPNKKLNDCVNIVTNHVAAAGGRLVTGWAIWEWTRAMIQAEFHMVWEDPNGNLLDLTPKIRPFERVLFLPDPKIRYNGRQIDSVRKPMSRDKNIERFISLEHNYFVEMNRGELADYHGRVILTPVMEDIRKELALLVTKLSSKYGPI